MLNDFPAADEMSSEWLTDQLHANGIEADVVGFDAQAVGTGQIGKCIRYTLRYAPGRSGPATLIGKFPSDDETSRATGVALRNFIKEVRFYQHLQGRLSIRTPRSFFAEIEGEGPRFIVLMEDLTPAVQGDQLQGCSPRVAHAAVEELVGLHAPSWCDDSLKSLDWLYDENASKGSALNDMYCAQLPGFLERYGHALADDEAGIIAQVGETLSAPLFQALPETFSLVHVDYRLDNLLINEQQDSCDVTVVDWQSITLGAPLNDVAYFLGAGLLSEDRRSVEEGIVRSYFDGLHDAGVTGFDWADCWEAYRRGVFAGFGVTVIASMLVQRTERGDQMFITMARRHARHALDLGGAEFLN